MNEIVTVALSFLTGFEKYLQEILQKIEVFMIIISNDISI